jgi:hypothetical protein
MSDPTLLYGMAELYSILVENTYPDRSLDKLWSQINQITGDGEMGVNDTGNLAFKIPKHPLKMLLG